MSDQFSPVEIVLDANTRSRCVIAGSSLQVPDANQQVDLFYGSQYLFMAQVFKGTPAKPYVFMANTAFYWAADSVYNHTPYPVSSVNDQFHIAGDFCFRSGQGLDLLARQSCDI